MCSTENEPRTPSTTQYRACKFGATGTSPILRDFVVLNTERALSGAGTPTAALLHNKIAQT